MGIQTMIKKNGTRYRVEVMINGIRHSETFKRKNDAEAYMKGMEAMRASHPGSNQYQEALKLGKAWTDFIHMQELAGKEKKSTIKDTKTIAHFFQHLFDKDVLEITDNEFVDVFKNARHFRTRNILKVSYLSKMRDVLKQIYKMIANKGFVRKDFDFLLARIEKEVKNGKPSKEGESYTQEEVKKIMETTPDGPYWVKPLFLILIITGKRIGEIHGLTWDKISFENMTIKIEQMISKGDFHPHLKLNAPAHEIEMDDNLMNIFLDLKAFQIMDNEGDSDWVFPSNSTKFNHIPYNGEHPCPYRYKALCRETLVREIGNFTKKAGVRHIRVHDLRRTSATLTYIRHANDKLVNQIVQTKLNHKKFDVTQKYIKIPKQVIKEHLQDSTISDILDFDNKAPPTQSESVSAKNDSDVEALKLKMKVLELELQLEQLKQKKAA